ncbi:acyltransferase [Conexibacter sp. SYSU D00693]|uniref:acyltransferase family protein n=1 Tax=Conexibacter sp. SYSU D00693 TaxID=2812560 RepID=UPI001F121249|nr:acyltransferase [Conexibacter sp. SYSU D00693]
MGKQVDRPGLVIGGDALRGIGMMCVMLFHAAAATAANVSQEAAMNPVDAFGPVIGHVIFRLDPVVWCFFALSGYLVGGSFVRAWVEGKPFPKFGKYAGRRLRRILPAFWVSVAVLYLIYGGFGASKQELAFVWFFAQTYDRSGFEAVFVQGWTVGAEMLFYFGLPLIAFAISRLGLVRGTREGRLRFLLVVLAVITVASLAVRINSEPGGEVGRSLFAVLWCFTPGLAMAALEKDLRAKLVGTRLGKQVALALSAIAVGSWVSYYVTFDHSGTFWGELQSFLIAASVLPALMVSQWAWGALPAVIDNPVNHALGKWSYGFYLVHVAIVRELALNLPDSLGATEALFYVAGITAVSGLSLAALSWWLLEEPFIERRLPRMPWQAVREAAEPPQPPAEEPKAAAASAAAR